MPHDHHSLSGTDEVQKPAQETDTFQTIAAVTGNILEWYDFAVFGFFSDIISNVFFPKQAGDLALVESFIVFGGAFLMRPIGGMLIGYIGDIYGRKRALEISMFLMAFPTFAMGCIPSYDRIGWVAIVLLVVIRLLQGLSVGGQLMSSLVFTLEKHPRSEWGLYGSYVLVAANFGVLLGGLVGYGLKTILTHDQLNLWGWRIPFLSGIVVSFSGVYLRLRVKDDRPGDGTEPENPMKIVFGAKNRRSLLACCMVPMLGSGGYYLVFVWMAIFMEELIEHPVPHAFAVNSASLLFSVCMFYPLAGILSDRYGRVRVMTAGGLSILTLGPVAIFVVSMGRPFLAFLAQSFLGILLSLWGAPMMAWMVERFPKEARLTACAIGYNIAQAVAGGFSPALATLLLDSNGFIGPGLLLSGFAMVSLTGLHLAPKRINWNHCEFVACGQEDTYTHVDVTSTDRARGVYGDEHYKSKPIVAGISLQSMTRGTTRIDFILHEALS